MERESRIDQTRPDLSDFTALGNILRSARRSQGRSLRSVADEAGISPTYLHAIEHAKNPKTGRPSRPNNAILDKLFTTLNIDSSVDVYSPIAPIQYIQQAGDIPLAVRVLQIAAINERKKAASMVLSGEIIPQVPNEIFNYRLEVAALYTSAAVSVQSVLNKLDKEIEELKTKYHIEEDKSGSSEVEETQQSSQVLT